MSARAAASHSTERERGSSRETCPVFRYRVVEIAEVLEDDVEETVAEDYRRRQYVNLDRGSIRGRGRYLRVKARIERVSGDGSLRNRAVYWRFSPEGADRSQLSDGYYDRLPRRMRVGFGGAGDAPTARSQTDEEGWTRPVNFYPSLYGGDLFTVWASHEEGSGGRRAGTYRVWRKLFIEIENMQRVGARDFGEYFNWNDLAAKFATDFVEVQRIGSDSQPPAKRMLRVSRVAGWARDLRSEDGRQPARRGRYVQLAFVDAIGSDPAPADYTLWLDGAEGTQTSSMHRNLPEGVLLDVDVAARDAPGGWLERAWVRQGSGSWLRVGGLGRRFEAAWNEIDGRFRFIVKQNGLDGLGLTLANRVYIKIRVREYHSLSGRQTVAGPCACIAIRWRELNRTTTGRRDSTLNTVLHEIGHALGLASTHHPDNSRIARPSETYRQNGLHCHVDSDGCIMYHANREGNLDFCDNCKEALRGRNITRLPRWGGIRFQEEDGDAD